MNLIDKITNHKKQNCQKLSSLSQQFSKRKKKPPEETMNQPLSILNKIFFV